MNGASGLGDLIERARGYSLLGCGVLDQPWAPLLRVNDALDGRIPIADLFCCSRMATPKRRG
jgi:hypothetical protein